MGVNFNILLYVCLCAAVCFVVCMYVCQCTLYLDMYKPDVIAECLP